MSTLKPRAASFGIDQLHILHRRCTPQHGNAGLSLPITKTMKSPLLRQQQPTPSSLSHSSKPRITVASAAAGITTTSQDESNNNQNYSYIFPRVVLPTAFALMLCNMDRICLSVAIVPLAAQMGWTEGTQGIIQSAFLWGYLANQLLGGTLADKYGGKITMAFGIAFFSLSSALLPLVAISPWTAALGITLQATLLSRFLVGFGEGVALPSMNNLVATRVPPALRATALGGTFAGFHTGNLVGLLVSPLILQQYGWRALFYFFSILGAPLLAVWLLVVPDRVTSVPNTASKEEGEKKENKQPKPSSTKKNVSIKQLLSNKAVWAVIAANFINHWGYFMYLNWMPTYFYKVLGLNLRSSSFFSFVPWLVMAAGVSCSGIISDALVAKGVNKTTVRKVVQTVAMIGPIPALLVLTNPNLSPGVAVAAMTAALGITSVAQFVTNMSDIAPRHAGRLFGLCNTFGSFSGILGVSIAGFIVEKTGSFALVFQITAALNLLGAVLWNWLCSAEKQFD